MPVDAHAHYVPPAMLDAHFDYGAKVRPFFPKLVESVGERSASMERQGVDRQVLSMWADILGYGLPDAQSRASFPPADRTPMQSVRRAGFSAAEITAIVEDNPRTLFPRLPAS